MSDTPEFAHVSFGRVDTQRREVDRVYHDFWLPEITVPELGRDNEPTGKRRFSLDKLKGELFDMHHLIINARAVYEHITGGLCTDLRASAEGIIAQAEAKIEERIELEVNRRFEQMVARYRRAGADI